jgi:small subunit ribosomal protein S11
MEKLALKKRQKKEITSGIAHIKTTFNNTIITVSDLFGNSLCWASSGASGLKGSRKATAFAAQMSAKLAAAKAIDIGIKKIDLILKGRGKGRESSIRAFKAAGLQILSIQDNTKVPFNGCRPPKKRRL